ncbi:MAG: carboxylate--amine ligase, partial [Varibaculum cambriense]|nr:carboxylate--amine ligase [Varibaculum cambriense]
MEEHQDIAFQPVIPGTDIGAYALARSFHEKWKVKPTLLTLQVLGPIMASSIIDTRLVDPQALPNPDSEMPLIEGLIALGPQLQQEFPGKTLLLIANMDSNVRDIMRREEELRKYYAFAFPSLKVIEDTSDKVKFPRLASEHGLNVPKTLEIDFSGSLEEELAKLEQVNEPFPWIIKPATSAVYERLKWPGKAKVYTVSNKQEAEKLLADLYQHTHENPHARRFVLQP